MEDEQSIIIRRGRFCCTIYEVGGLMELPLANVRKLFKIMFCAERENESTIQILRDWVPSFVGEAQAYVHRAEVELEDAKADAARKHSQSAVMGDGYWSKRVTAIKSALKRAKAETMIQDLTRALESATAYRDAPKLADQAVNAAKQRLAVAKTQCAKAQKLLTIFNDLSKI